MTTAFGLRLLLALLVTVAGAVGFGFADRFLQSSARTRLVDLYLLVALRTPILLIALVTIILSSLPLLRVSEQLVEGIRTNLLVLDVLLAGWLMLRFSREVVFGWATRRAKLAGSRSDEALIPILGRRILPLLIGAATLTAVLEVVGVSAVPLWAAVSGVGAFLGVVYREALGNLLAGLYLIVDEPFAYGDRIRLEDGTVYRVVEIGARVTKMESVADQTATFIPNLALARQRVANVTRLHTPIPVAMPITLPRRRTDVYEAKRLIEEIASEHPLVLGKADLKIKALRSQPKPDRLQELRIKLDSRLRKRAGDLAGRFSVLAIQAEQFEMEGLRRNERDAIASAIENVSRDVFRLQRDLTIWIYVVRCIEARAGRVHTVNPRLALIRRMLPQPEKLLEWFVNHVSPREVQSRLLAARQLPVVGLLPSVDAELHAAVALSASGGESLDELGRTLLQDPALAVRKDGGAALPFVLDGRMQEFYESWHRPVRQLLSLIRRATWRVERYRDRTDEWLFCERVESIADYLDAEFPSPVTDRQWPTANLVDLEESLLRFRLDCLIDNLTNRRSEEVDEVCSDVRLRILAALEASL